MLSGFMYQNQENFIRREVHSMGSYAHGSLLLAPKCESKMEIKLCFLSAFLVLIFLSTNFMFCVWIVWGQ